MIDIEMYVCVKNSIVMCHAYPHALEKVSFLRNQHRHVFHVQTCIEVHHGNREIEFFDLQDKVQSILDMFKEDNNGSVFNCEDITLNVSHTLDTLYHGTRKMNIEVSEDNENFVRILCDKNKF